MSNTQTRYSQFFFQTHNKSYPWSHPVFTLHWACFQLHPPLPCSVVDPQRKEILLHLTRFETNHKSCTGRSSENISRSSGGAQEEKMKDKNETSFCQNFGSQFPVTCLMPYYVETGHSRPPNHMTLQITLLHIYIFQVSPINLISEKLLIAKQVDQWNKLCKSIVMTDDVERD
jgi:hypothetical protein